MAVPGPSPSLAAKLLLAAFSLIVALALPEAIVRLFDVQTYYKNQFFPVNRDIDFGEIYAKDRDLFWKFRRDFTAQSEAFSYLSYHINSRGMRGNEFPREKQGLRILALGNSCTFGWGVDQANIWTTQLGEMLSRQLQQPVEVINAGVPGYSSHQGKIYFKRDLLALKPDIVVITFGWNDHAPAGKGITDADQKLPPKAVLTAQNVFSRLRIYQLMRTAVLSATEKQTSVALDEVGVTPRVPLGQFHVNLVEIVRLARDNHIQPVLVVPPIASLENYFGGAVSRLHRTHSSYQSEVEKVARFQQVTLVDLQAAFDEYADLFDDARADPTHYNAHGHAVAATELAKSLVENIIPLLNSSARPVSQR